MRRFAFTLLHALLLALALSAHAQVPDHNLRDYGAALDGQSLQGQDDNALEAAINAARSGVGSTRIYWRGPLVLRRPPPVVSGLDIDGGNMLDSRVYKLFSGGALWRVERPPNVGNALYSRTTLRNFSAPQASGTPGSYTILARADSGWAPHCLALENLYLGSGVGPGPFRTIEIDGSALVGLGIRGPRIHNVTVFGSAAWPTVYVTGTAELRGHELTIYQAGGASGSFYSPAGTNKNALLEYSLDAVKFVLNTNGQGY